MRHVPLFIVMIFAGLVAGASLAAVFGSVQGESVQMGAVAGATLGFVAALATAYVDGQARRKWCEARAEEQRIRDRAFQD